MWQQCSIHSESWAVYQCETCNKGSKICLQCFNADHSGHLLAFCETEPDNVSVQYNHSISSDALQEQPLCNGYDSDISSFESEYSIPILDFFDYTVKSNLSHPESDRRSSTDGHPSVASQVHNFGDRIRVNDDEYYPSDIGSSASYSSHDAATSVMDLAKETFQPQRDLRHQPNVFPIKASLAIELIQGVSGASESPNGVTTVETNVTTEMMAHEACMVKRSSQRSVLDIQSNVSSSSEDYIPFPKTIVMGDNPEQGERLTKRLKVL